MTASNYPVSILEAAKRIVGIYESDQEDDAVAGREYDKAARALRDALDAHFATPEGLEYLEREAAAKGGFQGRTTPDPDCANPESKPCANCNCWKFTREMCL